MFLKQKRYFKSIKTLKIKRGSNSASGFKRLFKLNVITNSMKFVTNETGLEIGDKQMKSALGRFAFIVWRMSACLAKLMHANQIRL